MPTVEHDFLKWVSDPARTNDELFTVEIMLEQARGFGWPHRYVESGWAARSQRARERKLNPDYRPALHLDELQTLIEQPEKRILFSGAYGEDRPMRDLSAFRFFPSLKQVSVQSSDVTDFTPLAGLKEIEYLSIAEYGDLYGCHQVCLAECGKMSKLERLHLALRHPWPDLRAAGQWPKLQDIRANGSILAWEDVPSLPAARVVHLKSWPQTRGELRDLRRLPLMPAVRELVIECVSSLEGVERYPSVVNLELNGCFRDLTPLAKMDRVTALKLIGERFHDLRPLTQMKNLRELTFQREWALDLTPLAECPQLRRVEFEHCSMMRTEVAALNAGLPPEADDFLAAVPRPLLPLKFYRLEKDSAGQEYFRERTRRAQAALLAACDGDSAMLRARARVFIATMQRRFDELLGRGWGIFEEHFTSIKRYKDTTRLRELIDLVRAYQASVTHPPHCTLSVQPHGDMTEELEEIRAREEAESAADEDFLMKYCEEEDVLQENEEWRSQRAERYELLKREHLRKLRGDGDAPAILGVPPDEPEDEEEEEEEEETAAAPESSAEPGSEGGVAIAPPPSPQTNEEATDLSEDLMFYLDVWEDCVTVTHNWALRAEYSLGQKFEEWTPAAESGHS